MIHLSFAFLVVSVMLNTHATLSLYLLLNPQTHMVHFYRNEVAAFDRAVTDFERTRYYERI